MISDGPVPAEQAVEPAWAPPLAAPRRRSWRRTAGLCAVAALAITVAGVPLGLLWAWLSPAVPAVMTADHRVVVNDNAPEQFIAADGWFTLLGLGFGIAAALVAWVALRRHRGPVLLGSVVLAAMGAALVAWQVGRQPGLAGFERWRAAAATGATFSRPPDLSAHGTLLVPAFAAAIVCTLLAGWSNDPDLDAPGHHPGYGRDLPFAESAPFSEDPPAGHGPTPAPAPPGSDAAVPPGSDAAVPPHG